MTKNDVNLVAAAHRQAARAAIARYTTKMRASIELRRENGEIRGGCRHAAPENDRHRMLIALGGPVGEVLAGPAGTCSGDALHDSIMAAVLPVDSAYAGRPFERADVIEAVAIVRALQPEIARLAKREIEIFRARDAARLEIEKW